MPLIKCSQCGKVISEYATKCPKCGLINIVKYNRYNKKLIFKYNILPALIVVIIVIILGASAVWSFIQATNS